ncbi:MAG: SIMPL domain-containing protein [Proteiniphilum sp.]|nr:SIMPL domain-containing protein [Proteiniphilum sp.]MDD3909946.1 SIMPL domain-containing protein [Proteiniphilum sp.]MDD4416287.1 SIMPL domain-containing protein [Proteiniphilum sp.]
MKNWRIESLIIAVGLTLIGVMINTGISNFKNRDRVVTVKGLAEMEIPADKVVWPLMYKDLGNDLLTLYNNIQTKNKTIVEFLQANGISGEEISVAPPEIIDMEAERYSSQTPQYRYNATSVITVTSKDVEKIRKLISEQTELLKQGVAITGGDYRYSIIYEFTGLNDVKPQMIEEATKNARLAAEKFAIDSGSKLGKIRDASQGQFSITDRDANTPYIKNIRVVTTINYYLKN